MQDIKLVDLSEIPLPNWLPNNYIQAIADAITSTGFVPPIICIDDELVTPDVVAALRTIKARNALPGVTVPFIPAGVAVLDGRWLVNVDRRISKVKVETRIEHHYDHDWYHRIVPYTISWRDAYWTYSNDHNVGGVGGVNLTSTSAAWSADQPTFITSNGSQNMLTVSNDKFSVKS